MSWYLAPAIASWQVVAPCSPQRQGHAPGELLLLQGAAPAPWELLLEPRGSREGEVALWRGALGLLVAKIN